MGLKLRLVTAVDERVPSKDDVRYSTYFGVACYGTNCCIDGQTTKQRGNLLRLVHRIFCDIRVGPKCQVQLDSISRLQNASTKLHRIQVCC